MKRIIVFALLLVSLFATRANAQTRFLFGTSGGIAFDNSSVGVTARVEIPFLKHYELDLQDTFSPVESHVALGGGRANLASVGGHIWLTNHWGLNGRVEDSAYNVTKVTKDADYAFGGLTYRGVLAGSPARLSFDYLRQFNNGVTPSGLESSHMQGGDIAFTVRIACTGPFCVRLSEDNYFGQVWAQGNPYCDGSIGPQTCGNRDRRIGGGFVVGVMLEFPRRRASENDQF
jgi:hypothetical protein